MSYFWAVISFVGTAIVLGLAVVGAIVVAPMFTSRRRRRIEDNRRIAMGVIQDITDQAQAAIVREAITRATERRNAKHRA